MLDPKALLNNAGISWRARGGGYEFLKRLVWNYSGRLPSLLRPREYRIKFCYPEPIGALTLAQRPNGGSDNFIHSEVFEHLNYRLPLLDPPRTVLDLGANIGLATIYFARMYPDAEIACVEPMPENLRLLRKNFALNAVMATVFEGAIDSSDGDVAMQVASMDFAHKIDADANDESMGTLRVTSYSVPTVMKLLGWSQIDLVKIDIEGHERILLSENCDWLHHVACICVEPHNTFGEAELTAIAMRYAYAAPVQLGGLWLLTRPNGGPS